MTLTTQRRNSGVPMSYLTRRRAPDITERLIALILAGGLVASLLLTIALTLGLLWLIAVIVADLARRLGL